MVRGADYVELVALVEELIDAHHDTIALCAPLDELHVDYLQSLTRAAHSTLARMPSAEP